MATLHALDPLRVLGVDPAEASVSEATSMVWENVRRDHTGEPFFDGETEPCVTRRVVTIGAYVGVPVDDLEGPLEYGRAGLGMPDSRGGPERRHDVAGRTPDRRPPSKRSCQPISGGGTNTTRNWFRYSSAAPRTCPAGMAAVLRRNCTISSLSTSPGRMLGMPGG